MNYVAEKDVKSRSATDQKTDGSDCLADHSHGSDQQNKKKKDEANAAVITGC